MNRRYYPRSLYKGREFGSRNQEQVSIASYSANKSNQNKHLQFSSSKYSEKLPQNHISSKRKTNFLHVSQISRGIVNKSSPTKTKSFISKKVKLSTLKPININSLLNHTVGMPSGTYISDYCYQTYQGLREYNEDRIQVNSFFKFGTSQQKEQASLFAIFDGHGGSSAAEFLQMNIVSLLQAKLEIQSPQEALTNTLIQLQSKVLQARNKIISGTCALVCLIISDQYYIANVGDSRALIIREHDYQQITRDHKPDCPIERNRIEANGGKIYRNAIYDHETRKHHYGPYRVNPGKLSVSRTIGDLPIKKNQQGNIISCEPQISKGKLNHRQIILLLSDGAYEKFSNKDICQFFSLSNTISEKKMLHKHLQKFMIQCKKRETCDNVSVICIEASQPESEKSLDNITCPSL